MGATGQGLPGLSERRAVDGRTAPAGRLQDARLLGKTPARWRRGARLSTGGLPSLPALSESVGQMAFGLRVAPLHLRTMPPSARNTAIDRRGAQGVATPPPAAG